MQSVINCMCGRNFYWQEKKKEAQLDIADRIISRQPDSGGAIKVDASGRQEHTLKMLVLGQQRAGKTSLIRRYVHNVFTETYRPTVGVDFTLKIVHWDEKTTVKLQLWDVTGEDGFRELTAKQYYKNANAVAFVYDVSDPLGLDYVKTMKHRLDEKLRRPDGQPVPAILLANMCDQEEVKRVEDIEGMQQYCKDVGFLAWFESSAKDNINVAESMTAVVKRALQEGERARTAAREYTPVDLVAPGEFVTVPL